MFNPVIARLRHEPAKVAIGAVLLVALVVPAVASATGMPSLSPNFHGAGAVGGAWLVQYRPDVSDVDATRAVDSTGATEIGDLGDINTHVLNIPVGREQQILTELARDPRVVSVEKDGTMHTSLVPADPHWAQAWGPKLVNAPQAWNMTTGAKSTIIAVVDTGVDPRQPDLRGRVLRGWDFQNNDANPKDDNGHGTAVAGVAAAAANDNVGIAGMCWKCQILPVKVLNANGSGNHSNIAAGIVWATKHGADVINLSLAGPSDANVIANAIQFARNHGVVVVAAAGNEGTSRRFYPAAYPGVISVGATSSSDVLYSWSNRGSWVKLSAPGCAYTGSTGPIRWSWWCGTSFATPVVAGTAALMKSLKPGLSRAQIERALLNSTVRVRGISVGRIDAAKALRVASSLGATSPPTQTPSPTPTATPRTLAWRADLDSGTRSRTRTFQLSGAVHLRLQWASGTQVYLRVTNSSGDVLVNWHDSDGEIDWNRTVHDGDFKVQVGEWSGASTSFKVTIQN